MPFFIPLLYLLLIILPARAASPLTNPICSNGNDPWVVQHAGHYYYCYSSGGINIKQSDRIEDICASESFKVWAPPAGTMYSRDLWAPELHYLAGKWYVYVAADDGSNDNHRMYVLEGTTQNPLDPFEFKGRLVPHSDRWAIDGTVLEAPDGELYFIWSGWYGFQNSRQDIYIAPMRNPWTIETGEASHRVEAESAVLNNASVRGAAGASGGGCAAYIDYADSYLEFTVDIAATGPYLLKAWYGNGTGGQSTHQVSVNGDAAGTLIYPPAGWDSWNAATVLLELARGNQTIRIAKGTAFAELDYFELFANGRDRVRLSIPEYDWELNGSPAINEGPEILIKNSSVHIIYSASGSWTDDYCLGQLTCTNGNFMDSASWTKKREAVFSRTDQVFGPGHASFVKSPDLTEDWIIYHSAKTSGSGWDRDVRTQMFSWNNEDSPVFGVPVAAGIEMAGPSDDETGLPAAQQTLMHPINGKVTPRLFVSPVSTQRLTLEAQSRLFDVNGRNKTFLMLPTPLNGGEAP